MTTKEKIKECEKQLQWGIRRKENTTNEIELQSIADHNEFWTEVLSELQYLERTGKVGFSY